MALPASGAISMSQVNTELGLGATAAITLNDSAVRTLFGKASGAISMSDGWGKSNVTHSLVAGYMSFSVTYGYNSSMGIGSLTPTTFNGNTISGIYTSPDGKIYVVISALLAQNHFTSVKAMGATYFTNAAATYAQASGKTTWGWPTTTGNFAVGTTYPITLS